MRTEAGTGDGVRASVIVCVLTGHGLKDPDRALSVVEKPVTVAAEISAVLDAIGF